MSELNHKIWSFSSSFLLGCRYEYRWADGVAVKEPIRVSAPEYVEYLMNWIETQIDNETIFPQKPGRREASVKRLSLCCF